MSPADEPPPASSPSLRTDADAFVAEKLLGRHILVVENDLADIIAKLLLAEGCAAADIAYDGEEGLACLSRQSYDLIVLNYHMPRMKGDEMLRRIRARGDRTPVIMFSAWDPDDLPEPLDDTAYDEWITKPFSHRFFLSRIAAALHRHGRSPAARLHAEGQHP